MFNLCWTFCTVSWFPAWIPGLRVTQGKAINDHVPSLGLLSAATCEGPFLITKTRVRGMFMYDICIYIYIDIKAGPVCIYKTNTVCRYITIIYLCTNFTTTTRLSSRWVLYHQITKMLSDLLESRSIVLFINETIHPSMHPSWHPHPDSLWEDPNLSSDELASALRRRHASASKGQQPRKSPEFGSQGPEKGSL